MRISSLVEYLPSSGRTVIVDIDNTVAQMNPDRQGFIDSRRKDWDAYYSMSFEDTPIRSTICVVQMLFVADYKIVFCTGRSERVREQTFNWIREHIISIGDFDLLMRPDGNESQDWDVKPKLIKDQGIKPEDVIFILEDRKRVVAKWRELGFECWQVAKGDY